MSDATHGPLPVRQSRKSLWILALFGLLLSLGAFSIAQPEVMDRFFGPSKFPRFRFTGTNRWDYMRMKLSGGPVVEIIRLGPVEVYFLDPSVSE